MIEGNDDRSVRGMRNQLGHSPFQPSFPSSLVVKVIPSSKNLMLKAAGFRKDMQPLPSSCEPTEVTQ